MTITIRPAAELDLPAIGEVHTVARSTAYAEIVPVEALRAVSATAMGDWWTQRWTYERDTHRLMVAEDPAGSVVGFSYVGPSHAVGCGELYAIHVSPDSQGGGIGRALMDQALRTLGELGKSRAVLWVLTENTPARRFYERAGWHSDGGRRSAPLGRTLTPQLRYARTLPH